MTLPPPPPQDRREADLCTSLQGMPASWNDQSRGMPVHVSCPLVVTLTVPPQALGYKQECLQLRTELESVQEKLKSSEVLRQNEAKEFQRRLSDTEEYLRSELYQRERRCADLEEVEPSERLSSKSL